MVLKTTLMINQMRGEFLCIHDLLQAVSDVLHYPIIQTISWMLSNDELCFHMIKMKTISLNLRILTISNKRPNPSPWALSHTVQVDVMYIQYTDQLHMASSWSGRRHFFLHQERSCGVEWEYFSSERSDTAHQIERISCPVMDRDMCAPWDHVVFVLEYERFEGLRTVSRHRDIDSHVSSATVAIEHSSVIRLMHTVISSMIISYQRKGIM